MAESSVEKDILNEIHRLGQEEQARVLEFARSLGEAKLPGVPGRSLLRFAGTIDKRDLEEMARSIDDACERVDPDEW